MGIAFEAPLVGRSDELALLDDAIDRVRAGILMFVLLEGEGGVGKSRLVEEALGLAKGRGLRVYKGRAEELERHRPFGPLSDALGCDRSSSVPECSLVARLLYPRDEQTGPLPSAAGPVLQYRVVEVFVELVQRLAAAGPLVLALEDVHWADSSTLLAIRSFTKRLSHLPVFILASFRPTPRSEELEALVQTSVEGGAMHLKLQPLDEDGVAEMATRLMGAAPGPRLKHLLSGAGGNPLFVTELLKTLDQEQALELEEGTAETRHNVLPPTLRLTILRRLTSVGHRSIEILRLASVIGARFSLSDLAAVSGRSALELLPPVQDALRAGLLVEAGPDLAFRHDLVREAIYQDLPASVHAELHREVARALVAAGAGADRIATHLSLARSTDPAVIDWLERAARVAAPRAPAEAADFFQKAVDLLDLYDPRRDQLLAELVQMRIWAGRVSEAAAMASEALDRPHASAIEGSLRLSLGRALMITGRAEEAVAVCEMGGEGLAAWERIQLSADASLARMVWGDLNGAKRRAEEALSMGAARRDDEVVAVSALSNVAMYRGKLDQAVGLATQVLETIRDSTDPVISHYPAHYFLSLCLVTSDRLDDADRVLAEGRVASEERGNVWNIPQLHWVSAVRGFLAGRWDDAITDAETGFDMAADAGTRQGAKWAYAVLATIAVHRGDFGKAGQYLERADREPFFSTWAGWPGWARGVLHELRGERPAAIKALEQIWAQSVQMEVISEYPMWGPDLIRLLVSSGGTQRARALSSALEDAADRMKVPYARGAALLARGLLEEEAETVLSAVEAYGKSARVFDRARAQEDAATVLGRKGRREEAVHQLEAALKIYEQMGARIDVSRASASLRALGVRRGARGERRRPATGWEALTPTEFEVAQLVGQGLSNSQIGQRMFISPRTVETHVSHLLSKLEIGSRGELIAHAARRFRTS